MEARAVIPNAPKALRVTDRPFVPEGAVSAMATPDFGRPQTKPTVNWVLGAGQLKEDQTTQQPQQIPIHQRNKQPIYQQNTQQLTPQRYGTSAMSSLQSINLQ